MLFHLIILVITKALWLRLPLYAHRGVNNLIKAAPLVKGCYQVLSAGNLTSRVQAPNHERL